MRTKSYRIRVRKSNGVKTWFAPGVGRCRAMDYGPEFTHAKLDDRDEAVTLAERIARRDCFLWIKVKHGRETIFERKP